MAAIASACAVLLNGCGGGGSGDTDAADAAAPAATDKTDALSVTIGDVTGPAAVAGSGNPDAPSTPAAADMMASAAMTVTASATGRIFYVDSRVGNDGYNGTAPTASGSTGPWKTLAKVAATTLVAGDEVRLVCGSTWRETLKVTSSGTASSPIRIAAYPAGCATPPAIDGGNTIAAGAWSLYKGSIYKATLGSAPLIVTSTAGHLDPAHFPNRGYDGKNPSSPYLRIAADSAVVSVSGRPGSTYLTTGSDLQLPAGASITTKTTVRIRASSWILDERNVASVSGSRINLTEGTSLPLTAGWGYFLLNELWMLDSPAEYFYDAAARQLYLWTPNGAAPGSSIVASTLGTGVDLQSRSNVVVDGLAIRRVGVGVNMRRTNGVVLTNATIEHTSGFGVDAGISTNSTVSQSSIVHTGSDAISGIDDYSASTTGFKALDNRITSSGVVVDGSMPISLPSRSRAAIRGGVNSVITGNRVVDAGLMGIWVLGGSTISGNLVSGACSVLDDCGGVYTSGKGNNGRITGNLIMYSRGAPNGKAGSLDGLTQAQGIYLDEYATGVEVSGNTVAFNADNGIKLHVASDNLVTANKVYGNRRSQIQMHANKNAVLAAGDLSGNVVTYNQVAPTATESRGVSMETEFASTDLFASFDNNKYLDRIYPTVGTDVSGGARRDMTLPGWKAALKSDGSPRNLDPNGRGVSQTTYAGSKIAGASVVGNGGFASGTTGWTIWNKTQPLGTLTVADCAIGRCGQFSSGTSLALLSSPRFSLVQDRWYRLSVDLKVGVPGQRLEVIVRRGGGGTNGYESVTSLGFIYPVATTEWQRFSYQFRATKTVNANDPVTGDIGVRFDVQNIQPGETVGITNLEIVPIVAASATTTTELLMNTTTSSVQAACPVANTEPESCGNYVRLSDDTPIAWPYPLPSLGSEIVYTRDASLVDVDVDGIPDMQDACPATPAAAPVNALGCSIGQ